MIEEIHGVHRVEKVVSPGGTTYPYQDVIVRDHGDKIRLSLTANEHPADLTPEEAEALAKILIASAKRVRKAQPS